MENESVNEEWVAQALVIIVESLAGLPTPEKRRVLSAVIHAFGLTVPNNTDVQVGAPELTPGQIEIMISRAIREQTGNVVAGQINDPNSPVTRSIIKNLGVARRII